MRSNITSDHIFHIEPWHSVMTPSPCPAAKYILITLIPSCSYNPVELCLLYCSARIYNPNSVQQIPRFLFTLNPKILILNLVLPYNITQCKVNKQSAMLDVMMGLQLHNAMCFAFRQKVLIEPRA